MLDIFDVPRYEGEVVHGSSRRHQGVNNGEPAIGVNAPPSLCNGAIDWQDSIGENQQECFEPTLQNERSSRVARSQPLDAITKLACHEDADEEIIRRDLLIPSAYVRIVVRLFSQLGYDVGVEQVH